MFDSVALAARGFPAIPSRPDTSDPDTAIVFGLIARIREVTRDALTDAHNVSLDVELSPQGVRMKQQRIAERAVTMVQDLAMAEASRAAMAARLAAAPIPTLDSVSPALFAPILAVLQNLDAVERMVKVREWARAGELDAAVILANLPAPLALVTKAEAAELRAELRTLVSRPEAAKAGAMQDAIEKLDAAGRAAIGIIRDTAGMKVEGVPFKVPA